MVVRRNDSRRRRVGVVVDPTVSSGDGAGSVNPAGPSGNNDGCPYSFGANRRNQPKTTDLVPKRILSFSIVIVILLACLGLLNVLALYADSWREKIGADGVAALALTGRGTLASWFSSFLLTITGLASLQIYALRQHRRDDYRGTYRLWFWMAALLLVASLNCVVDLETIATSLMHALSSNSLASGHWLPFGAKMLVFSTLIGRGLYEVRASRGAFACVVVVWVAYAAAAVLQLPPVRPAMSNLGHEFTVGNCLLLATTGLLVAELTYARFIFLQAHGLIKLRRVQAEQTESASAAEPKTTTRKATRKKPATDSVAVSKKTKIRSKTDLPLEQDAGQARTRTSASARLAESTEVVEQESRTRKTKSASRQSNVDPDDRDEEGVLNMSKAERRRQRKQEQSRRAA